MSDMNKILKFLGENAVHSYGENTNGSWIRLNNGWQVCCGSQTYNVTSGYMVFALPIPFMDSNYNHLCIVRYSNLVDSLRSLGVVATTSVVGPEAFSAYLRNSKDLSYANGQRRAEFFAIGKWKNVGGGNKNISFSMFIYLILCEEEGLLCLTLTKSFNAWVKMASTPKVLPMAGSGSNIWMVGVNAARLEVLLELMLLRDMAAMTTEKTLPFRLECLQNLLLSLAGVGLEVVQVLLHMLIQTLFKLFSILQETRIVLVWIIESKQKGDGNNFLTEVA